MKSSNHRRNNAIVLDWPKLAIIGLICTLFTLHGNAGAQTCEKSARWSDDAPYSYRANDGQLRGVDIELITETLASMGCSVRWVEMPWARALVELQQGRLDILPGARKTDDREVFAYFSRPVNHSPNVLFMSELAAAKYPLRSLGEVINSDLKLGIQIGVAYSQEYETFAQTPEFKQHLTKLSARRNGWQMMAAGRIDAMISDEITAMVELQNLGLLSKIHANKAISTGDPAHVMFSKISIHKEFVIEFDRVVNTMIADGRYRNIRTKYIPCPVSADGIGCK